MNPEYPDEVLAEQLGMSIRRSALLVNEEDENNKDSLNNPISGITSGDRNDGRNSGGDSSPPIPRSKNS